MLWAHQMFIVRPTVYKIQRASFLCRVPIRIGNLENMSAKKLYTAFVNYRIGICNFLGWYIGHVCENDIYCYIL